MTTGGRVTGIECGGVGYYVLHVPEIRKSWFLARHEGNVYTSVAFFRSPERAEEFRAFLETIGGGMTPDRALIAAARDVIAGPLSGPGYRSNLARLAKVIEAIDQANGGE